MTEHRSQAGHADLNNTRFSYEVTGQGSPLVLIHAGIADSRMWKAQRDALSNHFQVITYDMRGFGGTGMVAGPFTHYDDLAALLEHLGVERAAVVGASMGGATAINFALAYPEKISALVLVGSAIHGYRFTDEATREQINLADENIEGGNHEVASDMEMKLWVAGPRRAVEEVDPAVRDLVRQMMLRAYQTPPDLGEEDTLEPMAIERLAEISVPTLVLVGEHDVPDMQAIADKLTAEIQGAEKQIIEGAAHLPAMEKPDQFNGIVLNFLSRL